MLVVVYLLPCSPYRMDLLCVTWRSRGITRVSHHHMGFRFHYSLTWLLWYHVYVGGGIPVALQSIYNGSPMCHMEFTWVSQGCHMGFRFHYILTWLLRYHVNVGGGIPVALQSIVNGSPRLTSKPFGWWDVIFGGTEMKKIHYITKCRNDQRCHSVSPTNPEIVENILTTYFCLHYCTALSLQNVLKTGISEWLIIMWHLKFPLLM